MTVETMRASPDENLLKAMPPNDHEYSGDILPSIAASTASPPRKFASPGPCNIDQEQPSAGGPNLSGNTIQVRRPQNDRVRFQETASSVDPPHQAKFLADGGVVANLQGSEEEETEDGNGRSLPHEADQPLLERVKKAPELMKQFEDYIRLMEDRICALEADRASSGKGDVAPTEQSDVSQVANLPDSTIRPTPAIPGWTFMSSEEYEKEKGRPVPASHYAIDILIDKPSQALSGGNEKSPTKANVGVVGETTAPHSFMRNTGGDSQDLPERIRINSNPVKHILDAHCNRGLRFQPGFPLVLQRPFKALVYHETALREHLAALEQKWGPRRMSAPAETSPDARRNDPSDVKPALSLNRSGSGPNETDEEVPTSINFTSYPNGNKSGQEAIRRWSTDQFTKDERATSKNIKEENQAQLPPGWGRQKDWFGRVYYTHHATKLMTWTRPRSEAKASTQKDSQNSKIDDDEEAADSERQLDSEEAMNDMRCLIRFMDEFIKPVRVPLQVSGQRNVRFSELWHLFQPGQLIYVNNRDVPQKVWRVLHTTGGRRYLRPPYPDEMVNGLPPKRSRNNGYSDFILDCYSLDYDGSRFAPKFNCFTISKFDDAQIIDTLPVYPISIAQQEHILDKAAFMERGQQFVECTKVCHRYYSGRSLVRNGSGARLPFRSDSDDDRAQMLISETIEGEVMIDFDRAFQRNPDWLPSFHELKSSVMDPREIEEDETDPFEEKVEQDDVWDRRRRDEFINGDELKLYPWPRGIEPSGDDLLLLPDRVFGFVLRSRKWARLAIDLLRPIEVKTDAWDDLELPEGHKEIVQSLIRSHFAKEKSKGIDLARDKGRGLIVLLHGAPGVGKTSTAECVAQSNNRPLLPITCGDLGLTPRDVETKLDSAFQLAQAWDCVLLLDEADIFLAARTTTDLERNALVSVFLRVLEYYEGLLFLTTNRVGAFDEAFKSRIHMALYYPFLDRRQTIAIWRSQLRRIKSERKHGLEVDEDRILDFANELFLRQQQPTSNGIRWNGRQIRNAFQSALAIAEFAVTNNTPAKLEINHFEKVAKASVEFEDYLWRVKSGRNDADIAAHNMMRADNYGADHVSSNSMHVAPKPAMGSQPAFKSRPKPPANMPYMPQQMQSMSQNQLYQMSQPQGYPSSPPAIAQYQQPGSTSGGYLQPSINMNGYDMAQQPMGHNYQPSLMQQGRGPPGTPMQHVGEGRHSPPLNQQQASSPLPQMQNQSTQQVQHGAFSPDNYRYS